MSAETNYTTDGSSVHFPPNKLLDISLLPVLAQAYNPTYLNLTVADELMGFSGEHVATFRRLSLMVSAARLYSSDRVVLFVE